MLVSSVHQPSKGAWPYPVPALPFRDVCRGTFTLDGRRYSEPFPGSAAHTQGQSLQIIVVPGDPALQAPACIVNTEHSSWTVYVLPAILFIELLLILVGLAIVCRRDRAVSG
jgi:hypothetical protein